MQKLWNYDGEAGYSRADREEGLATNTDRAGAGEKGSGSYQETAPFITLDCRLTICSRNRVLSGWMLVKGEYFGGGNLIDEY